MALRRVRATSASAAVPAPGRAVRLDQPARPVRLGETAHGFAQKLQRGGVAMQSGDTGSSRPAVPAADSCANGGKDGARAFGGAALALVGVQQALGGQAEVIRVLRFNALPGANGFFHFALRQIDLAGNRLARQERRLRGQRIGHMAAGAIKVGFDQRALRRARQWYCASSC